MRVKSEMFGRMPKRRLKVLRDEASADIEDARDVVRPRTRGDCASIPRPCPFVTCRYSLFADASPRTGTIKYNFVDPESMTESCALDVADRGSMQLMVIGEIYSLSRERIRQVQDTALGKVRDALKLLGQLPAMEAYLAEAEARGARGTPLALAQEPTDFVGTSYPVPGAAADEPEEAERTWTPGLPSIFDETVSEERYCEAFRSLWDRVRTRRQVP